MREIELLHLVDEVYRTALDPDSLSEVMHKLARSMGGVGAVVLIIGADGVDVAGISPDLVEANAIYLRDDWGRRDTAARFAMGRRLSDGAWFDRDHIPAEQRARDPFYQEFRRSVGVDAIASMLAAPVPGSTMSLSVQLPPGCEFDTAERALFTALSNHVVRAVGMSSSLGQGLGRQKTLADALADVGCAAALIGADNRVAFVNAAFERLEGDAFVLQQGQIRTALREQQAAVDRLIDANRRPSITSVGAADHVLIRRRSGRRPVLLRAVPVALSALDRIGAGERGQVLVLAVDLDAEEVKDVPAVLRQFGLTAAEARIAAVVGQGVSPKETADLFGIAESTVRVSLKRAFSKLDIARQGELVALVGRIARGLAPVRAPQRPGAKDT